MVHHGTSWYHFYCFFCIWWLSQDRMQVPGEMCTCYCMLSWPTWQASRCLPLLEWLQKKESSKNPRSEVQTPACLSWCIFAHILTSFILLPCTMRTSCAIKGHWSLLAKAATSWIRPTCTVVFQTFGQTNAITPRKNQIAPKKLAWKPLGWSPKWCDWRVLGGCICLHDTNSLRVAEASGKRTSQIAFQHDPTGDLEHGNVQIYRTQQTCAKTLRVLTSFNHLWSPIESVTSRHLMAFASLSTQPQNFKLDAFYTWCELETLKNMLWPKMMPYLTIHHISRKKQCMKNHEATLIKVTQTQTHPATDWHIQSYKPWHFGIFFAPKLRNPMDAMRQNGHTLCQNGRLWSKPEL